MLYTSPVYSFKLPSMLCCCCAWKQLWISQGYPKI